jgi:hypothetical protein
MRRGGGKEAEERERDRDGGNGTRGKLMGQSFLLIKYKLYRTVS